LIQPSWKNSVSICVDRALKKIEEGSYGLSDRSGKPIARERLEAVPEALYTLSEEQAGERSPRPR